MLREYSITYRSRGENMGGSKFVKIVQFWKVAPYWRPLAQLLETQRGFGPKMRICSRVKKRDQKVSGGEAARGYARAVSVVLFLFVCLRLCARILYTRE